MEVSPNGMEPSNGAVDGLSQLVGQRGALSGMIPRRSTRMSTKDTVGKETRMFNLWEDHLTGVRCKSNNNVRTNRYNWVTFLPVNLFEQFSNTPINLYFLLMCVLQTIPSITITGGVPTTVLPLAFVVIVAMIKDGIEDYKRYQSDKTENNRTARRLKIANALRYTNDVEEIMWKDVKVGDTLLLKNFDLIPADLVICASSDKSGLTYIETANLDGETNLKVRTTPQKCMSLFERTEDSSSGEAVAVKWNNVQGTMETELPNGSLYTFQGTMSIVDKNPPSGTRRSRTLSEMVTRTSSRLQSHDAPKTVIPLEAGNILLRGCKLRNTEWVVGKVVFAGRNTKIQMDQTQKAKRKRTQIEKFITNILLAVLLIQLVLCIMGGLLNAAWIAQDENRTRYLNIDSNKSFAEHFFLRFGTASLIFVNFIPISIAVTLSMVKYLQVLFIAADKNMEWNGTRCVPKTSDLNEELGQVEYVFSDKTGTLTQNLMEFRKCSINGTSYGQGLTEIRRQVIRREGKPVPPEPQAAEGALVTPSVNFIDPALERDIRKAEVTNFFLHLAINHSVLPEVQPSGKKVYSAASPDEGALVYGAQHFGFNLVDRPDQEKLVLHLQQGNKHIEVQILATIEFTSDRKRSSVVARFQHPLLGEEVLYVFTKGADTMIKPILKTSTLESEIGQHTLQHLDEYAVDGLRTLMLGGRLVGEEEFRTWSAEWEECSQAMTDRAKRMALCADKLECDLDLHGVTGVEDRLQGEVGETIEIMQQCGIKVWMLTGDKVETAINIGIATGLLEPFVDPRKRPVFDWDECVRECERSRDAGEGPKIPAELVVQKMQRCYREVVATPGCFEAVVIDGMSLSILLKHPKEFLDMTRDAHSVLCCRVSPDQKGQVVRLFKKQARKVTLAIGDGANDCNMIRSAHIGIGIRGEEGLQAFNVSDFGIGQFRFLSQLLLVYGREYYRRQSILVLIFFYKNSFVVLPQFAVGVVSALSSGTRLYPDLVYQLYNVMFTALPIFAFCLFDKDLQTREAVFEHAHLYTLGPKWFYLNKLRVFQWIANAFWHSLVLFSLVYIATDKTILREDGLRADSAAVGILVFNTLVIIVNIKLILESYYVTWIMIILLALTLLSVVVMAIFFNYFALLGFETFGAYAFVFSSPLTYAIIAISITAVLARDWYWKIIQYNYFPTPLQIILQSQKPSGVTVVKAME